ncbi:MAG: transglycosylase family protein [Nocardioides sp.]
MRAVLNQSAKRPAAIAAACAVTLTVVVVVLGMQAPATSLNLSLDGKEGTIEVHADTVGEALADAGVEVGPRDIVVPSLDSEVTDGDSVSIHYARKLTLRTDGKAQTHWVTGTTLAQALSQIGRSYDADAYPTSRSTSIGRSGLTLQVFPEVKVKAALSGKPVSTEAVHGPRVADGLEQLGVEVDRNDLVTPGLMTPVRAGMRITFTDVVVKRETVAGEPIAASTEERSTAELYVGQSRVARAGVAGSRNVVYRVVRHNGVVAERTVISQQRLREPVSEIVEVGTKPVPLETGTSVWDRLAQCESGGNWQINTGNGYYGGLQFSLGTWQAWGGTGLPSSASRETQIAIATKVRNASGGYGAWPSCSAQLGLPN